MNQFFKDILTTKDGSSFDIGRAAMVLILSCLVFALMWGMGLYTYGYFFNKPFNIQEFFNAILNFAVGASALIVSGSVGLKLKSGTEPNAEAPKDGPK